MSTKNRVVRSIAFSWASLAINLAIAFFLAPFIVHRLGNLYYGIWALMMQFTGYLGLLESGVRESIIKYVARHRAEGDSAALSRLVSAAISMYSLLGILALGAAGVIAAAFPFLFKVPPEAVGTARIVVMITGTEVALGFVFNVFPGILMGLQRFDVFGKISIVFHFVRAGLIVALLSAGFGIVALGLIHLALSLISNLIIFVYCRRRIPELRIRVPHRDLGDYRSVFTYSKFVFLNNISLKAIFYTDAIVIGMFQPASAITFYAIPQSLVGYVQQFVKTMTRVFNPLTSELETRSETEKIQGVLYRGSKFALLFGLPVFTVFFVSGNRFISLWMGPEYGERSWGVLVALTVAHLFSLPHYTIGNMMYGLSRHSLMAYTRVVEAIANLILSVILVRSMGIVGVAIGTAIPHLVTVIVVLPVAICRAVGVSVMHYFRTVYVGPMVAAIPFGATCWAIQDRFPPEGLATYFLQIAVALPVYAITVWLVGLQREERADLRGILVRAAGRARA